MTASKPRRKVRMMPHGPSTPDESEPNVTLGDDRESTSAALSAAADTLLWSI